MAPRRSRFALVVACAAMAFIGVLTFRSVPVDPASRLPARYRLADLIQEQQRTAADLRRQVDQLRTEVDAERAAAAARSGGAEGQRAALDQVSVVAGLTAVHGPGLKVTLADSDLSEPPPGGSVNDLVIHSQDVQAVVNAMWRAGAEAVAINGQRLVGTSAVLCVGNTLLLNGTVHSPPYAITAIGASRPSFDGDRLVRRLKSDADTFHLSFSEERLSDVELPAYGGSTRSTYAKPST